MSSDVSLVNEGNLRAFALSGLLEREARRRPLLKFMRTLRLSGRIGHRELVELQRETQRLVEEARPGASYRPLVGFVDGLVAQGRIIQQELHDALAVPVKRAN